MAYANLSRITQISLILLLAIQFSDQRKDSNQADKPVTSSLTDASSESETVTDWLSATTIQEVDLNTSRSPETPTETATTSAGQPVDSSTAATTTTTASPSTSQTPINCPDDNYCLNGGTCVLGEQNQMICICPEGFYGARCQTRNICKTIIADSLTGDQVCAKIDRECLKSDKFFRCVCHEDEYFIFKHLNQSSQQQQPKNGQTDIKIEGNDSTMMRKDIKEKPVYKKTRHGSFDEYELDGKNMELSQSFLFNSADLLKGDNSQAEPETKSYIAECRKVDKCLGLRCKQLSEVCSNGECICNQDSGYIKDPQSAECKLLNPCKLPTEDGKPICGQARCVATYDQELYKCICPLGYQALRVGSHKNSTVCTILRNLICKVPLLNKCQHICEVDNAINNYKCSCLRGYKPGTRPGIDDHMCFFIEQEDQFETDDSYLDNPYPYRSSSTPPTESDDGDPQYIFRPYLLPKKQATTTSVPIASADRINYDPGAQDSVAQPELHTSASDSQLIDDDTLLTLDDEDSLGTLSAEKDHVKARLKSSEIYIKRERVISKPGLSKGRLGTGANSTNIRDDLGYGKSGKLGKLTAQERCNMYCEENKICELEIGSTDSYRCVCNRQGYVSVGDRCLDWCAAADFEWQLRGLLDYTCWSGVCKPSNKHPALTYSSGGKNRVLNLMDQLEPEAGSSSEMRRLEFESSWRPSFECDCSASPLLVQDPETKLCKFNFQAALDPCKPGQVGYIDCVEHKNAYCSVLYKPHKQYISEHQRERFFKNPILATSGSHKTKPASAQAGQAHGEGSKASGIRFNGASNAKNQFVADKLYTCVCSPEKKFLVDKPRNKERCVDECDLLNTECGRFNRMCRPATIASDDFGRRNLVKFGPDEARLNFKRTGCECLPGFNVGPSESVDFTLDDNVAQGANDPGSFATTEDQLLINMQMAEQEAAVIDPDSASSGSGENSNRAKYMNINSRCLLDYDVVEFHASFKAPVDFDPNWIEINNLAAKPVNNKLRQSQYGKLFKTQATIKDQSNESQEWVDSGASNSTNPSIEPHSTSTAMPIKDTGKTTDDILSVPDFMRADISELHEQIVLVAQCDPSLMPISIEAFEECTRYRYWIVQKMRNHFVDWRKVVNEHLKQTFDLMDGNIRLRVNKCRATLKSVTSPAQPTSGKHGDKSPPIIPIRTSMLMQGNSSRQATTTSTVITEATEPKYLDPLDQQALVDADIHCELTLHSASDDSPMTTNQQPRYMRKVLLEKQLQKFIFALTGETSADHPTTHKQQQQQSDYYLMAPNMLIRRESFDKLAKHRKEFNPCKSDYAYCEKQTRCDMIDTVNYTCTCEYGYTPIGSRDIYFADSRKEVCEDINECLFDVCKELANVSTCINEIGDYRCQCNRHYIGDNKRYCKHVCSTIPCKHGKCRLVDDHHAFCECDEGYKETDCSVQDPNVALRKANMIICGSIFTSVLLLAITFAISLNSQLKKTKKKLKRLEAANEAIKLFEFSNNHQQGPPFTRSRMSKVSVCS